MQNQTFNPKELSFCPYLVLMLDLPNFESITANISHEIFRKKVSSAYRKLALKYHPDRHPDKRELFEQIKKANDILADEQKKKAYDVFLKNKYENKLRYEK